MTALSNEFRENFLSMTSIAPAQPNVVVDMKSAFQSSAVGSASFKEMGKGLQAELQNIINPVEPINLPKPELYQTEIVAESLRGFQKPAPSKGKESDVAAVGNSLGGMGMELGAGILSLFSSKAPERPLQVAENNQALNANLNHRPSLTGGLF